jgi:imidazolonepropionase-like amidohydrolase
MQTAQCEEFDLRATVEPRWDTLRAATIHAARLFQEAGTLGEVTVGARADLIVVESLDDLGRPDSNLKAVVKSGVLVLNRLGGDTSATL